MNAIDAQEYTVLAEGEIIATRIKRGKKKISAD